MHRVNMSDKKKAQDEKTQKDDDKSEGGSEGWDAFLEDDEESLPENVKANSVCENESAATDTRSEGTPVGLPLQSESIMKDVGPTRSYRTLNQSVHFDDHVTVTLTLDPDVQMITHINDLNLDDEADYDFSLGDSSLEIVAPQTEIETTARSHFTILSQEYPLIIFRPADGGFYAWFVCFTAFWAYGLCVTTLNIYGIVLTEFAETFPSKDVTSKLCK